MTRTFFMLQLRSARHEAERSAEASARHAPRARVRHAPRTRSPPPRTLRAGSARTPGAAAPGDPATERETQPGAPAAADRRPRRSKLPALVRGAAPPPARRTRSHARPERRPTPATDDRLVRHRPDNRSLAR